MAIEDNVLIYNVREGKTLFRTYLHEGSLWMDKGSTKQLLRTSLDPLLNQLKAVYTDDILGDEDYVRTVERAGEPIPIYNLDIIIALGYISQSIEAPRFRRWAYRQIQKYVTDEEFVRPVLGWEYFEHLRNCISIVKNTEMILWYKIQDIYALSKDYRLEGAAAFFYKMRRKIFWGVFKNTPEELIVDRIDAEKPHLGLLHYKGNQPDKAEALFARNFLNKQELERLDGMIRAFLNMAESQAGKGKTLTAADWVSRLEGFLQMTGHTILLNQGEVSPEEVRERIDTEFEKWQK